jgi:hypothetical protein
MSRHEAPRALTSAFSFNADICDDGGLQCAGIRFIDTDASGGIGVRLTVQKGRGIRRSWRPLFRKNEPILFEVFRKGCIIPFGSYQLGLYVSFHVAILTLLTRAVNRVGAGFIQWIA